MCVNCSYLHRCRTLRNISSMLSYLPSSQFVHPPSSLSLLLLSPFLQTTNTSHLHTLNLPAIHLDLNTVKILINLSTTVFKSSPSTFLNCTGLYYRVVIQLQPFSRKIPNKILSTYELVFDYQYLHLYMYATT